MMVAVVSAGVVIADSGSGGAPNLRLPAARVACRVRGSGARPRVVYNAAVTPPGNRMIAATTRLRRACLALSLAACCGTAFAAPQQAAADAPAAATEAAAIPAELRDL